MGHVTASATPADPVGPIHARETRAQATNRWTLEGRRAEVATYRGRIRDACMLRGMMRFQADEHAWDAAMAAYPPPGVEPVAVGSPPPFGPGKVSNDTLPPSGQVQGLGDIPADWPALPPNASLQAELGWVQAHRLDMIEERPGGATVVHLSKASTPAPSKASLAWLETSIRSYAKYTDILARALSTQADEAEHVHRERRRIEDMRRLLAEMMDNG